MYPKAGRFCTKHWQLRKQLVQNLQISIYLELSAAFLVLFCPENRVPSEDDRPEHQRVALTFRFLGANNGRVSIYVYFYCRRPVRDLVACAVCGCLLFLGLDAVLPEHFDLGCYILNRIMGPSVMVVVHAANVILGCLTSG